MLRNMSHYYDMHVNKIHELTSPKGLTIYILKFVPVSQYRYPRGFKKLRRRLKLRNNRENDEILLVYVCIRRDQRCIS